MNPPKNFKLKQNELFIHHNKTINKKLRYCPPFFFYSIFEQPSYIDRKPNLHRPRLVHKLPLTNNNNRKKRSCSTKHHLRIWSEKRMKLKLKLGVHVSVTTSTNGAHLITINVYVSFHLYKHKLSLCVYLPLFPD